MIKAASLVAMLGSASAFVPSASVGGAKSVQVMKMGLEDMVGAGVETGNKPWDPLNLSKLSDVSQNNPHVNWLRESELKHGRVAMLASVGVFATSIGARIPGYPVETKDWTAAYGEMIEKNPLAFVQILLFIGIIEGVTYPGELWFGEGRAPGALGYDPLGFAKKDKTPEVTQLKELKNGRAAMIAMAAYASHELIPGSVPLYDALGM
uniref:Plastid light harvesting protein n=1 Tax=Heterosigma akashiwo TaxID=2829 RepID=A0A6V1SPG2_HETAK|eukprot:CAMPEP_0194563376 /NCGR_PEP_ID=MMETSP0292-20121207/3465_1 /TAXON_ID=39354 /ORGANISM="Heterosigma akashiwo, Strain CCMP2393" /LENGTH=207 /DNA_ID=CAMNT_0039412311 /DNA_START=84 /DNA_END=707 /DNA_ORIENTATION=+